jgi:hypothetical protein
MTDRPRFGSIATAVARYGIGRSSFYELAKQDARLFRKFRSKTLVDFGVLDEIMDELPCGATPKKRAVMT